MKATGICRRVDNLGRIVIPKEIRRNLRIRDGSPLEIFTEASGEIILKKYSPINDLGTFAREYAESLAVSSGHIVCITDCDIIIAVAGGPKKDLLSCQISKALAEAIDNRTTIMANKEDRKFIKLVAGNVEDFTSQVVCPIICEGDAIGSVVITTREDKAKLGETEMKLAHSAANFLGKQLES